MQQIETLALTRLAAPARKWRNRYWFSRQIVLPQCASHDGGPFGPGVLVARLLWPSQEVAEATALSCIERHPYGRYVVYLGAEPV